MGVSTATPNLKDDNTSTIEPNRDGDSSIKTLQQFSNTALATVSITYYCLYYMQPFIKNVFQTQMNDS